MLPIRLLRAKMADKTHQFPNMWITQNVAVRELVSVSCVLYWSSMASSAKRRAIETGQNTQDSNESSDEGLEDSGDEGSEDSEQEINEVSCYFNCYCNQKIS